MMEILNIILLVLLLGIGGGIGYILRVSQKVEDRKDSTYLTKLPIIYSNLDSIISSLDAFTKNDDTINNLFEKTSQAIKGIREVVFSSDFILFKDDLHDRTIKVLSDIQTLNRITEKVMNSQNANNENLFRTSLNTDMVFEHIKPKDIFDSTYSIRNEIRNIIKSYKSFSWWLLLLIISSAIVIGFLEIVKDSNFAKSIFDIGLNSTKI